VFDIGTGFFLPQRIARHVSQLVTARQVPADRNFFAGDLLIGCLSSSRHIFFQEH